MPGRGIHRTRARWAVSVLIACFGLFAIAPASSFADEIGWMYDPDAVVEIALSDLSPEELDELEAEPTQEVPGTFELKVDGVTKGVPLTEVGIRLKGGFGSARPVKTGKSGLKIRFDEFVKGQRFFGIRRLTLNNMIQDPSMVHETLSYELFHALGLPASRTGYAFVTLNGTNYGLFLNLETLDEISLPQWFATTQHLYEADAPGTDLTPGDEFEVDEGDDEDIADLEALIVAVNDEGGDWSDGLAGLADLQRITAQWAVERYVAHWDGYAGIAAPFRPNNYYLHSEEGGVFQMMPWGTDQTWERDDFEFGEPAGGVMFNRCLEDASCRQLYFEGLTGVYCTSLGLNQGTHAAQLGAMLQPFQEEEDAARRESTAEEIEEELQSVEEFAAVRGDQLAQYLNEQGALAADPCGLNPPKAPIAGDAPPAFPRLTTARIGPSRALGSFVRTHLRVDGPATATQRVTARFDGHRVTVCTDHRTRATAGRLTVYCRLSERALKRLESGPLRIKVRVGFIPEEGTPRFVTRGLTVPERT
jgi:hypothetical protein